LVLVDLICSCSSRSSFSQARHGSGLRAVLWRAGKQNGLFCLAAAAAAAAAWADNNGRHARKRVRGMKVKTGGAACIRRTRLRHYLGGSLVYDAGASGDACAAFARRTCFLS